MPDDKPIQQALFDKGEWWDEHWQGMPEFIQKDLAPAKTIYVHFANRSDMEAFARLVGQPLTMNTQCIWYPEAEIGRYADKRYIDSLLQDSYDDDTEVLDGE